MKSLRNLINGVASLVLAMGMFSVPASVAAAGTVTFSVSPSTGTYIVGNTFTVSIFEDSGANDVDSARADLTYSQSALQLLEVTNAGTPFPTCVTPASGGNGSLTTGDCTLLGGKKQGKQKLGQATFKVLADSGTATVNFSASSQAVNAGADLAESFVNGTYTLTAPAPSTPAPQTPQTSGQTPASNTTGANSPKKNVVTANGTVSASAATSSEQNNTSPDVEAATTTSKQDAQAVAQDTQKTSSNAPLRIMLLFLAAAAIVAGIATRKKLAGIIAGRKPSKVVASKRTAKTPTSSRKPVGTKKNAQKS